MGTLWEFFLVFPFALSNFILDVCEADDPDDRCTRSVEDRKCAWVVFPVFFAGGGPGLVVHATIASAPRRPVQVAHEEHAQ